MAVCVGSRASAAGLRRAAVRRTTRRAAYAAPVVACAAPEEPAVVAEPAAPEAAAAPAPAPPSIARPTGVAMVPKDEGFSPGNLSFGTYGSFGGLGLLAYGFAGYFAGNVPGSGISSLLLIYGFIISLLGFAFKYAELKPLECDTYVDAEGLREAQATPIQRQVISDVTRFRYGDEVHLDEALERIFRYGKPGGIRRAQGPKLMRLREQTVVGRYALVLEFESKKLEMSNWEEVRPKFQSFFGPGVEALLGETEDGAEVALVSDGSAAGEMADTVVLPPLMPGLPSRQVKREDL